MSKVISFEEMQQQYNGEWLLIAYTDLDENMQVKRGEVLAHSHNQEKIYQALESVKNVPVAIEYVGDLPEDMAFIL